MRKILTVSILLIMLTYISCIKVKYVHEEEETPQINHAPVEKMEEWNNWKFGAFHSLGPLVSE